MGCCCLVRAYVHPSHFSPLSLFAPLTFRSSHCPAEITTRTARRMTSRARDWVSHDFTSHTWDTGVPVLLNLTSGYVGRARLCLALPLPGRASAA